MDDDDDKNTKTKVCEQYLHVHSFKNGIHFMCGVVQHMARCAKYRCFMVAFVSGISAPMSHSESYKL